MLPEVQGTGRGWWQGGRRVRVCPPPTARALGWGVAVSPGAREHGESVAWQWRPLSQVSGTPRSKFPGCTEKVGAYGQGCPGIPWRRGGPGRGDASPNTPFQSYVASVPPLPWVLLQPVQNVQDTLRAQWRAPAPSRAPSRASIGWGGGSDLRTRPARSPAPRLIARGLGPPHTPTPLHTHPGPWPGGSRAPGTIWGRGAVVMAAPACPEDLPYRRPWRRSGCSKARDHPSHAPWCPGSVGSGVGGLGGVGVCGSCVRWCLLGPELVLRASSSAAAHHPHPHQHHRQQLHQHHHHPKTLALQRANS